MVHHSIGSGDPCLLYFSECLTSACSWVEVCGLNGWMPPNPRAVPKWYAGAPSCGLSGPKTPCCKILCPCNVCCLGQREYCAGCKQCKHAGNRKGSIAKHSKRNPCSCCPPEFVAEHHTCQPRPDMPCQCDFHTKEPLRLVDKVHSLLMTGSHLLEENSSTDLV